MGTTESNPTRKHIRVLWHEYDEGFYFITICTKDKSHHFGKIYNGIMHLSTIGEIADYGIKMMPTHYRDVTIQQYMVMPNHIHIIIKIESDDKTATYNRPITGDNRIQNLCNT